MSGIDLAQTFFIDSAAVQNAPSISITSIDLFFEAKPTQGKARSGIYSPGVTVYLCDTNTDNSPNLTSIKQDVFARVEYASINADTSGSTVTTFTFSKPISVRTNAMAAFLISFDGSDPDFKMWFNKAGQVQLGTSTLTSVTSGKVDGNLFVVTNGTTLTSQKDADLSFKIKIARFSTTPQTFKIKNRPYEILKVTNTLGSFFGGETVYSLGANATGTIVVSPSSNVIVGSGTTFTSFVVGDNFVITDGNASNTDVRRITSIANTTQMTVDVAPSFANTAAHFYKTVTGKVYFTSNQSDHLIIQDSTSNSTVYLSTGNTIYGVDSLGSTTIVSVDNYKVNAMIPSFVVGVPNGTTVNTSIGFANSSLVFSGNVQDVQGVNKYLLNKYPAILASHTTEATTASAFTSLQSSLTFTTSNPYVSPYVDQQNLDMFLETIQINNDETNEYLGTGNAQTRYVSKITTLSVDQFAEDIKVYLQAYKPINTDIKVYVKFRNSTDIETLSVKNWTELTPDTTGTTYSSSTNIRDYLQLEYSVPFKPTGTTQSGTFTTQPANNIIAGTSGTVNTGITVGDVVTVYNPFATTNDYYFVSTVIASNTTTFTIATPVVDNNVNLVGSGFNVDVVTRKNSAFLDASNKNVLTYYNSALSLFKGYDSFVVKIVLLSDNGYAVPFVDDLRAVAVSA